MNTTPELFSIKTYTITALAIIIRMWNKKARDLSYGHLVVSWQRMTERGRLKAKRNIFPASTINLEEAAERVKRQAAG